MGEFENMERYRLKKEAEEQSELERLRVEVVNLKGDAMRWADLSEMAWGIIANAGGGDWFKEHPAWKMAAEIWRDKYHAAIGLVLKRKEEQAP